MKKLLILTLLIFSVSVYSQEFPSNTKGFPIFGQMELPPLEDSFIGSSEVRPCLSMPVRQFPEKQFTLTEVNFNKKEEKRQVNLIAMMEMKRTEKEKATVQMESPMPDLSTGEKALIEITNDIRMRDRSSNFDIYTGQKKIPAYEEMQTPLFRRSYAPYSGRGYYSPNVYYNPYLR